MAEEKALASERVRLVRDDITLMDVDAFVYYARPDLALGTGFGGAISARGGRSIAEELGGRGPVETCGVVVSGAGDLKARNILHAVGPRFQEADSESKLRRTMRNVFHAAEEHGIRTLAFPAMGAGFYGIPLADCARVMVEEIEGRLAGDTTLAEVVICANDRREEVAFAGRLGTRRGGEGSR